MAEKGFCTPPVFTSIDTLWLTLDTALSTAGSVAPMMPAGFWLLEIKMKTPIMAIQARTIPPIHHQPVLRRATCLRTFCPEAAAGVVRAAVAVPPAGRVFSRRCWRWACRDAVLCAACALFCFFFAMNDIPFCDSTTSYFNVRGHV